MNPGWLKNKIKKLATLQICMLGINLLNKNTVRTSIVKFQVYRYNESFMNTVNDQDPIFVDRVEYMSVSIGIHVCKLAFVCILRFPCILQSKRWCVCFF